MPVSLRIVIGVTTAVIVLVVASVTLAITYTVSVGAVRDTGERLAEAITTTVALEVQNYLGRPEDHLFVYRNSQLLCRFKPTYGLLYQRTCQWRSGYA